MENTAARIPERLEQIIQDFQEVEGREVIELLLEYSDSLPDLPEWLQSRRDEMEAVPECMTPVFLFSELQEGRMILYLDVPAESPTVRGYAEIMRQGLTGSTPQQILALPSDVYLRLGLEKVLTHQRLNGLAALLGHIKHQALQHVQSEQSLDMQQ